MPGHDRTAWEDDGDAKREAQAEHLREANLRAEMKRVRLEIETCPHCTELRGELAKLHAQLLTEL